MNDLSIKKLSEVPHLKEEVLKIIHQELKYGKNDSFLCDFYPLFNSKNHQYCYIAIKGQEVVGHIGVKKRILGIQKIETAVILLGGIVVKKEFQEQGILKFFLNKIIDKFHDEVAFYLLWSDLTTLYNKFNFWECGETAKLGNSEFFPGSQFKFISPHDLNSSQIQKIKDLYAECFENKYLCLKRLPLDWEEIFNITSCKLYIEEKDQKLHGYFFKNKGHDLQGVVHEMANIECQNLKGFNVWTPYQDSLRKLNPEIIYTAFIKLGNNILLNKFFNELTNGQLIILGVNNKNIDFTFKNINYTLQHSEFLRGIFGPEKIDEFRDLIPPLFIAGNDSV